MRLAKELGIALVDEMLATMFSSDIAQWKRFSCVEPFGRGADEIHLAALRAHFANDNRRKGTQVYKASDFMVCYNPPKKPQTVEQIYALMSGMR